MDRRFNANTLRLRLRFVQKCRIWYFWNFNVIFYIQDNNNIVCSFSNTTSKIFIIKNYVNFTHRHCYIVFCFKCIFEEKKFHKLNVDKLGYWYLWNVFLHPQKNHIFTSCIGKYIQRWNSLILRVEPIEWKD